jgi:hypothetical protein
VAVASSKSKTRKSMRVATVFTGVAACAVGAAPLANAQETHPATNLGALRPAGPLANSIRKVSDCARNGVDKTWLHVSTTQYIDGSHFYFSMCFGFKGAYHSPPGTGVRAECGGNNFGFLLGSNNGVSTGFDFGPGTTYHGLNWSHLYTVGISSWSGTKQCPLAPDFGGGGPN